MFLSQKYYYIKSIRYCSVEGDDLPMIVMNAERMSNIIYCSQHADDIDSATLISLGRFEM